MLDGGGALRKDDCGVVLGDAVLAGARHAREAELVAAARGPAALRRTLARVAGRMVATRGWERLGFARRADYAAERAGISGRELGDLANVDAALRDLPILDAAFVSGEIGWTQLRLLCRVATPEDEARWLERASRLTARELAREVRQVDARAHEPLAVEEHDGRRVGVVLRLSRRAQIRWWKARGVASRVAGRALSHEAFAEVLAAEVLSGVPLDGDLEEGAPDAAEGRAQRGEAERSRTAWPSPPVSPLPASAEVAALERNLDEADAFELDRRLRRAVQMEARGLAQVAERLAEVVAGGLHRDLGYRSLDAYAEERLGMAASRARALLRIERAAQVCPPLREAFAQGELSWVQAHALLPLLLEPASIRYRSAWIAHAQRVSVRRLADDVEQALATGELALPSPEEDPAGLQTGASIRSENEDTCLAPESARLFFLTSPEVACLFRAVLATVQRRLERLRGRPARPSDALEAMLDHALAAWQPERKTPREWQVFERDGWRCTVPGCTSYRNLHQHHVVFRSAGGPDDPSNLTTLCAWHHLRGVHGRVLRCAGAAPGRLTFELGLRAGAPPLATYLPGEILEKRGGRFSRNEVTPSLKSGRSKLSTISRIASFSEGPSSHVSCW